MIYLYRCDCGYRCEVWKEIAALDDAEYCDTCGLEMKRTISHKIGIRPNNHEPYYNHGLGIVVESKRDIKEHLARLQGETGRELIEVGDQQVIPGRTIPERVEKDLLEDYHGLGGL